MAGRGRPDAPDSFVLLSSSTIEMTSERGDAELSTVKISVYPRICCGEFSVF